MAWTGSKGEECIEAPGHQTADLSRPPADEEGSMMRNGFRIIDIDTHVNPTVKLHQIRAVIRAHAV